MLIWRMVALKLMLLQFKPVCAFRDWPRGDIKRLVQNVRPWGNWQTCRGIVSWSEWIPTSRFLCRAILGFFSWEDFADNHVLLWVFGISRKANDFTIPVPVSRIKSGHVLIPFLCVPVRHSVVHLEESFVAKTIVVLVAMKIAVAPHIVIPWEDIICRFACTRLMISFCYFFSNSVKDLLMNVGDQFSKDEVCSFNAFFCSTSALFHDWCTM